MKLEQENRKRAQLLPQFKFHLLCRRPVFTHPVETHRWQRVVYRRHRFLFDPSPNCN